MEEHSRCPAPRPPGSFPGGRAHPLVRNPTSQAPGEPEIALMQNVNAAMLPHGDPPLFLVKLQGCNLYTNDFVFVLQFTRCSVVLRDRRTRSPNARVDVGRRFANGKNKVGMRLARKRS